MDVLGALTPFWGSGWLLYFIGLAALLGMLLKWRCHAIFSQPFSSQLGRLPCYPILGNGIAVLRNVARGHDFLYEVSRQYQFRTWAFSVPFKPTFFMVTSPDNLEYILKTKSNNFIKGRNFQDNLGQILGKGIFAVDGQEWYWQRKLGTHIFNVRGFKAYTSEVFSNKLDLLVARLAAVAEANTPTASSAPCTAAPAAGAGPTANLAPAGSTVDLHDLMYRFTLDTFSRIGFGIDPGCLTTPGKIAFAAAFDRAQVVGNDRFWTPMWGLVQLLKGDAFRMHQDIQVIRAFARGIIAHRQQKLQQKHRAAADKAAVKAATAQAAGADGDDVGPKEAQDQILTREKPVLNTTSPDEGSADAPADLLTLFMAAKTPDGKPLSEEQLIDTVLNFIIAGRDTTAQALSWTFYLLLQHPEVQEKLLQEADEVLGGGSHTTGEGPDTPRSAAASSSNGSSLEDGTVTVVLPSLGSSGEKAVEQGQKAEGPAAAAVDGLGGKPCYDDLRRLKYARAVFLEGLRLYPSVPMDCKFAVQRDVLPDGTAVPAGACMVYAPFTINRLPDFWGKDAQSFRPERWLEMSSMPSAYSYISFNAGPRICLGRVLAELEGVYVLVGLLRRFKFSLVNPKPVTYTFSTTLPMKGGLLVKVEPRV